MRLILLAVFVRFVFAEPQTYVGHKVLRFAPSVTQFQKLSKFENAPGFDFWKTPRKTGDNVDVMVAPEQYDTFKRFLESNNIDYKLLFENVQDLIDAEKAYERNITAYFSASRGISFTKYHRHAKINAYLHELADSHPDLVSLQSIGKSYQGRDLSLIKISSGDSGNPAVLIDAGIHAREWITPAMALYIINQLVENNTQNSDLTTGLDWYILPVLNPDGYEYSHTSDRMWRKTRSPTPNPRYPGVDGNRNFDFHWMENGASRYPYSETYAGPVPFSEVETQAVRDFALANKDSIKLYLTFHSYGDYIFYPWGYTSELPPDAATLHSLAKAADDAHVAAGGNRYRIGSPIKFLGPAAGNSADYMKGVAGIELSYALEFTDTIHCFQLPASQIQQTVTRFFPAIRVFGEYVKRNF